MIIIMMVTSIAMTGAKALFGDRNNENFATAGTITTFSYRGLRDLADTGTIPRFERSSKKINQFSQTKQLSIDKMDSSI